MAMVGRAIGPSLSPTVVPLDWADSEPEEDKVQTIRADALQQMEHYL